MCCPTQIHMKVVAWEWDWDHSRVRVLASRREDLGSKVSEGAGKGPKPAPRRSERENGSLKHSLDCAAEKTLQLRSLARAGAECAPEEFIKGQDSAAPSGSLGKLSTAPGDLVMGEASSKMLAFCHGDAVRPKLKKGRRQVPLGVNVRLSKAVYSCLHKRKGTKIR